MITQIVKMIDRSWIVVATAEVIERGEGFTGWVDLSFMPASLRQRFEEYEEIVNGQMFSLLDQIEEQIQTLLLKIRFDSRCEIDIADLQIYPSTSRISFKLVEAAAQSTLEQMAVA